MPDSEPRPGAVSVTDVSTPGLATRDSESRTSPTSACTVAWRFSPTGGVWIEFVIAESGIGLTDQQKTKLFRPFVQADASVSRKYGGTGLGLALVRRFCQTMGGDVSVASQQGASALFTVLLPVTVVAQPGHQTLTAA
jgi:signal transduction histidine kinase